jgi:hypothetical protein
VALSGLHWTLFIGLKIRVSVVRFRPWPPIKISTYVCCSEGPRPTGQRWASQLGHLSRLTPFGEPLRTFAPLPLPAILPGPPVKLPAVSPPLRRQGRTTMMTAQPLNSGLFKLHRIFYVAIAAFTVIWLLISVMAMVNGKAVADDGWGFIGLAFLPLGALHWYAAKGARNGKSYGRILSRVIGTFWLLGLPIGTALGVYVWSQTGRKWRSD